MRFILASSSPRRAQLLRAAGIKFLKRSPDTDETPLRGEKPRQLVRRLALEKALSIAPQIRGDALILAADTIVIHPQGQKVLGKPRNRREAQQMLTSLQGRTHVVETAYALLKLRSEKVIQKRVRVVRTRVKMRKMTSKEVLAYLRVGESMDKAGAYAAQGSGMTLIQSIGGSYTNVVGLPMCELLEDLRKIKK